MLINDERFVIATTDTSILEATDKMKLSKQNCDEIFGVVNVEKLAHKRYGKGIYEIEQVDAYIEGFNKPMELMYTLEDLEKAYLIGCEYQTTHRYHIDENLMTLKLKQQPTEIEVEIVMGDSIGISDLYTPDNNPKLDSEGCLILKRVVWKKDK
jgi:hypothetical protein